MHKRVVSIDRRRMMMMIMKKMEGLGVSEGIIG